MTKVRRPRRPRLDPAVVQEAFRRFREAKRTEAEAKSTAELIRDNELMPALVTLGEPHGDHGQHRAVLLPEPVDGFVRVVRRTNVSTSLDLDAAERLARDKGIYDEVTTVTVSISGVSGKDRARLEAALQQAGLEEFGVVLIDQSLDQDLLYAAHQRNRELVSEKELDALLVRDTRYSLNPEKS